MSDAVSRDLPIPASPESSTTCPSLVFALDQRRSSNSSSSSRPTRAVKPIPCSASKRLSNELARSAGGQHLSSMPERDAKFFEIVIAQVWKYGDIDIVLGKTFSVLGHAELFEPV